MSAMLKQKLIDIANGFTKYGLWKGGGSGGSSALSEMSDVTFTDLQKNDVLTYNGSVWVNDDNLQKQIDTLNSNFSDIGSTHLLMHGGYSDGSNVDISNLSIYKTLTFIAIWDNSQFLNCTTIPLAAYNSFYFGLLRLSVSGDNYIEIRPVSDNQIYLKCSSPYLTLRVFGSK